MWSTFGNWWTPESNFSFYLSQRFSSANKQFDNYTITTILFCFFFFNTIHTYNTYILFSWYKSLLSLLQFLFYSYFILWTWVAIRVLVLHTYLLAVIGFFKINILFIPFLFLILVSKSLGFWFLIVLHSLIQYRSDRLWLA